MSPSLQTCPLPVIEHIVELLDLADIRNLRLSCTTLATKACGKLFESIYVDLTADSLLAFAEATQTDSPLSKVNTLHLVGTIRELDDSTVPSWERKFSCSAQTEDQVQLLSQAFDGLARYKTDGILPSLSLRVAILRTNNKRALPRSTVRGYTVESLCQCTVNTFNMAIRALTASKLRVAKLNIFNGRDMQNCSLSCDQLNMFDWTEAGVLDSLSPVTTLSISLMDRVFALNEDEEIDEDFSDIGSEDEADWQPTRRDEEIMTASRQESNFSGLANLIAICPHLDDFELHYLSIMWPKRRLFNNFPRQDILRHVAELDNPPMLKRCRIRGVSVREADMLNLIHRTKVAEISIEVIRLEEGTLRPVIDYCISKLAAVTKLHIDTVLEKSGQGYTGLVHFLDEGESRKYGGKFEVGTEILNREGDNRTKPVKYYVRRPVAEGNPAVCHWIALRRQEFIRALAALNSVWATLDDDDDDDDDEALEVLDSAAKALARKVVVAVLCLVTALFL
ncbi:hypothetical protein H633G_03377 [Metarhizium anisopliae BRIP 53284]|nr:hypothetical protein H633G_03377 [Metarhizium anisopliae BRIP 53284]